MWQGFYYYEPGWSPIWELVAAGVTYSQSHGKTGIAVKAPRQVTLLILLLLMFPKTINAAVRANADVAMTDDTTQNKDRIPI